MSDNLRRILKGIGRIAKGSVINTPEPVVLRPGEVIVAQIKASSIWWGLAAAWAPLTLTSQRLVWKPPASQFWAKAEDVALDQVSDVDEGQRGDWLKFVTASRVGIQLKSGRRLLLLVWCQNRDELDTFVAKVRQSRSGSERR
jgi:hypothetical protein